jgi:hypothetical protein
MSAQAAPAMARIPNSTVRKAPADDERDARKNSLAEGRAGFFAKLTGQ